MNGALPLVTDTPMSLAPGNFDTPLVEYDRKRTSLCSCIRVLSTGSTLQVCEAEVQVVSGRRCLGNDGLGKKPRNAGGRRRVILLALIIMIARLGRAFSLIPLLAIQYVNVGTKFQVSTIWTVLLINRDAHRHADLEGSFDLMRLKKTFSNSTTNILAHSVRSDAI